MIIEITTETTHTIAVTDLADLVYGPHRAWLEESTHKAITGHDALTGRLEAIFGVSFQRLTEETVTGTAAARELERFASYAERLALTPLQSAAVAAIGKWVALDTASQTAWRSVNICDPATVAEHQRATAKAARAYPAALW